MAKFKSEREIEEEIWKIIAEEIANIDRQLSATVIDITLPKIKKRVNNLLNENIAILVYKP